MRKLRICGRDIAEYTIVLRETPAPAEVTAAEFLGRVITAACGVTLPVAESGAHGIYIGTREASSQVKWDGFRMTTDNGNVYLDGNIPRGTLFAVYDFAEKYVGWRSFAHDCEVIPTEGEVEVPCGLDVIDNPTFEERRSDWYCFEHHVDFMNRCRINTNPYHHYSPNVPQTLGGAVKSAFEAHSLGDLLPADEYFAEHPEYYALVNGERIPCYTGAGPGQLCLTNPEVLEIITEKILQQLREDPERTVVEVSQCDNHSYCRCETCTAIDAEEGSPSGTVIRFVNAVAEAVEKEFPHVLVRTFAYEYSRIPPKKTRARHNVLVRYCTYDACFRHAINDPNCALNRKTTYREMMEWQKMCDHMSIWDYVANWDCYIAPFPNLRSLRENARFFDECHGLHVFSEDIPRTREGGVFCDLKAYLIGKLLWNAYMSEEEYDRHINEFLAGFYGKAWTEMRRYLDLEYEATADHCCTCKESIDICFIHVETNPPIPGYKQMMRRNYTAQPFQPMYPNHALTGLVARLPEAKACFDRALALAETEVERERIQRGRISLTYLELFCSGKSEFTMSAEEKAAYMAEVEQFYKDKEKYGFFYNMHTYGARRR